MHHYDYTRLETEPDEEGMVDYLDIEEYEKREKGFLRKYEIEVFGDAFEFMVFYNSIEPMSKAGMPYLYDVINLQDKTTLDDPEDNSHLFGTHTSEDVHKRFSYYAESTPIAILINPYMSQNDIIDLVRVNYKEFIKPVQENFRSRELSAKETRSTSLKIKHRDDFIYRNKELPIKELTAEVNKRFRDKGKFYDHTYIQSILKKELNKRGENK